MKTDYVFTDIQPPTRVWPHPLQPQVTDDVEPIGWLSEPLAPASKMSLGPMVLVGGVAVAVLLASIAGGRRSYRGI